MLPEKYIFNPQPSRKFTYFQVLLHFLAISAMYLAELPFSLKGFALVLILAHYHFTCRQLERNQMDRQLIYSLRFGWSILTQGVEQSIVIQGSSVLSVWLVVVHYKYSRGSLGGGALWFVNDSLPLKDFKRLIVLLKISQPFLPDA